MARATDADRPRPTRRSQAGSRRDDCLDAAHYRTDEPAGVAVHANVRSRHTQMNTAWLLANEGTLRLGAFVAILVLVALIERRWPARRDAGGVPRTLTNLSLVFIGSAVLRIGFPVLAVGLASRVHTSAGGLFGLLHWPGAVEIELAEIGRAHV